MCRPFPRRVGSWIGACLALWLAGGAVHAEALSAGSVLCAHSLRLPIPEDDPRTERFQTKLLSALRAADFQVPDPAEVDALVERVHEQSGGFIDPFTGLRDAERFAVRRTALAEALRDELGCDARLLAHVEPVLVYFAGGRARWDGATDKVASGGRILLGGANEYGFMRGFSLWLRVLDLEGDEIAFRSAGIETLVDFAVLKDQDLLPEDQWLSDDAKIEAAIRSALGATGVALRQLSDPHRFGAP
jgi:hypothetical protein